MFYDSVRLKGPSRLLIRVLV